MWDDSDGSGIVDNVPWILSGCAGVEFFVAVASAAGPDVTTESFGEAAANYGPITITSHAEGTLGPDKPDTPDTPPVLTFYDPGVGRAVTNGPGTGPWFLLRVPLDAMTGGRFSCRA